MRTRSQRDQALRDLGAARTLLRREAWLEHQLREVAAAAASGEISEHDLADMAASRLKKLLDSITAAVRRADPEGLTLIGYAGPPSSPPRLRWDERTSAAQAIRTRRLARVEQYGPPTAASAAFVAAHALTCGVSAPVQIEGRTWGSITVTTSRTAGFSSEDEQLLDRFAQLVAAPLATAHAHEQVRFRARLEEGLREVATASASGEMDQHGLGKLAAERVADLLGSPGAGLTSVRGDRLVLLGAAGRAASSSSPEVDERSAVAEAIRTAAPVVVEDYRALGGPYDELSERLGCTSGVAVPVFLGGKACGGFSALLPATVAPSEAVALMERFAAIISAALANAEAQARLRFRARFEEALSEVAAASVADDVDERTLATLVAERIVDLLGARVAALARFGPDGTILLGRAGAPLPGGFHPSHPNSSLGRVAERGTTVVIDDYQALGGAAAVYADEAGIRGAAAVPVFVAGTLWGAIGAVSPLSGFTTDAPELLERFAQLISAALANAQAQTRLRDEARLERMLQRITAASATGRLTDRSLGQLVADGIAELLDARVSAVVRRDGEWLTTMGKRGSGVLDRFHVDEISLSARVVKSGSVVRLDKYADLGGDFMRRILDGQPVGSAIGVPVRSHGRLWGCLIAGSDPTASFDSMSEHWLVRFAQLISATLANTEAQALLRERAAVMASLHDGLVVLDDRGAITAVNEPLCTMTGFAAAELVGRPAPYPFSADEHGGELEDTQGANAVERVLRRRDGSLVRVVASVSTFAHGDGSSAGRAAILKDVSESVTQARLERAMRTVATASADGRLDERGLADLVAQQTAELLDAHLASVVRFDGSEHPTVLGHAGDFVFPKAIDRHDRSAVSWAIAHTGRSARIDDYSAVDGAFASLATEHDIAGGVGVPVRLDGRLWGCLVSMTHRVGGFPPGTESLLERFSELLSVALANVRSVRRLQQEARIEHALREVASASASGQYDAGGLFTLVAARVAELLEAPLCVVVRVDGGAGTVVGRHGADHLSDGLGLEDGIATARPLTADHSVRIEDYAEHPPTPGPADHIAAHGYRTAVVVPVRLRKRAWGYIAAAKERPYSFTPDAESLLERFAALVSLALSQATTLAELQRQATTDDLTGLLNHRAFQERLQEEFARATRHGRPLSLVMFDLDGFKLINDLHGHEAGNRVLRVVGQSLQEHGRRGDVAARIGGDEFAVIAPEADAAEALHLASRLRTVTTNALRALHLPLTLSAGVTDIRDAATVHDLFHLADSALYYAKHHGRDQVVRDTDDERHHEMSEQRSARRRAFSGLTALVRAVDARDPSTQRHAERVAEISVQLAVRLGWSAQRCARLREAALLHDVGKIGVPDAILSKTGPLSEVEYGVLKGHTALGAQITTGILDDEQVSWIRSHHERPDGGGYPDGLSHGEIPDGALVLGIADAYDAMTCGRPYQRARSAPEAISEIRGLAGAQFDPALLGLLEQWAMSSVGLPVTPPAAETSAA